MRLKNVFLLAASTTAAIVIVVAVRATQETPATDAAIAVHAEAVPLNPEDPSQSAVGPFAYAGGLVLTSKDTELLHGLSDLEITGADRVTAVSDDGLLFTARLVLDVAGRLSGVSDGRLTTLVGEDGQALVRKEDADSEGLAILPGGDRLVSFERHHRILRYPASGGPPLRAPSPEVTASANGGMEALAADPGTAPDAYVVGIEETGAMWSCRLSAACVKATPVTLEPGMSLVALRRLPAGRTATLLRGFAPSTGSRIVLVVSGPAGVAAQLDLSRPLTVDNFEGVAAVPRPDGAVRFYLLSDDNGSPTQRTLLIAFDWRP